MVKSFKRLCKPFFTEHLIYCVSLFLNSFLFGINMLLKFPQRIAVFTYKSPYMQRIADYVRTGHIHYIQGVISLEKVFQFHDKLLVNLPIFDDKLKAFRAREKGEPTARIMFWRPKTGDELHWIVLLHATADQLPKTEKWRNALTERIELTGYELLRETKKDTIKPVWTWRYRPDRYADLRDSLILAIRSKRDQDVKLLIQTIWGTSGFSGSRHQAKQLIQMLKKEWESKRPNEPMPELPKAIGYVRRQSDKIEWYSKTGKWSKPIKKPVLARDGGAHPPTPAEPAYAP